ncbi:MAG: NADPH-dependent curcumin reductase CurA [Myxococcota bacterium]|jgi:NADPH-dependent curcumin reductase CurA
MSENTQVLLAARPMGLPKDTDWSIVQTPIAEPDATKHEVLIEVVHLSLDPAMRGWMNDVKSYIPPVQLGAVMRAGGIGRVLRSAADGFAEGDWVYGMLGWQRYATVAAKHLEKLPARSDLPRAAYLGVLGIPGLTAYFGLLDLGTPKAGETVLVSAASGAVGSITGQIAKLKGCRVVGIAGGPAKCKYVVETLGYDDCIDYKGDARILDEIRRTCPDGVDVYFDNVGGEILEAALRRINRRARIIICGAISVYNNTTAPRGPANYLSLLVQRARMEGFVVFDYADRYAEARTEMAGWLLEGKLTHKAHIIQGLENAPQALLRLFSGDKLGKLIVQVAPE